MKKAFLKLFTLLLLIGLFSCGVDRLSKIENFSSDATLCESFSLTINDPNHFVIYASHDKKCCSGEEVIIYTTSLCDGDLSMYLNDEYYSKQKDGTYKDDYVWKYSFIMPSYDVIVSFQTKGMDYTLLSSLYTWIDGLTLEDLDYAINENNYGSVAPSISSFNTYTITSTNEELEKVYYFLKQCVVYQEKDPLWTGGSSKYLTIHLKNGNNYTISSYMNGFTYKNNYYEYMSSLPSFSSYYGSSFFISTIYDFTYIQDQTLEIEKIMDERTFLSNLIFKETSIVPDQIDFYKMCYLKSGLGTIHIIDDKYFKIVDLESNEIIYEIVNNHSFNELVKHNI